MQWVQFVLQHTQIFSWHNLKNNIHIPKSKINQYYTHNISTAYSWHGQELSKNYLYFYKFLNIKHKTYKFKHNISHNNISFLDALIQKDKRNTLQTILYQKPADLQSYFHAYSDHPKSLKKHTVQPNVGDQNHLFYASWI